MIKPKTILKNLEEYKSKYRLSKNEDDKTFLKIGLIVSKLLSDLSENPPFDFYKERLKGEKND